MLRSLTFAFATVFAVATLAAQAPAQDQPAGDRPAVQQAPPEPAQQPSQPPAREPAASPKSTSDSSKVTMTGCLKPGATAGSWTLETSPAAAGAASPSTPVGTSGAAGAKQTYSLIAKPSDDLKPHANHKIEVVGTVSPAISARITPSEAAPRDAAAPRQTFNVESFKMVSPSCQ